MNEGRGKIEHIDENNRCAGCNRALVEGESKLCGRCEQIAFESNGGDI